jgi:hypothetical protein
MVTVLDELAGDHVRVAWDVEDWLQSPRRRLRVPTLRDKHLLGLRFHRTDPPHPQSRGEARGPR